VRVSFQVVPWSLSDTSAAAVVGCGHGNADAPRHARHHRRRPTTQPLDTVGPNARPSPLAPPSACVTANTRRLDERIDAEMEAWAVVAGLVAPAVSIATDLTAGHRPASATSQSTPPKSSSSTGPDCEKARSLGIDGNATFATGPEKRGHAADGLQAARRPRSSWSVSLVAHPAGTAPQPAGRQ
jgi:hypothetical protein